MEGERVRLSCKVILLAVTAAECNLRELNEDEDIGRPERCRCEGMSTAFEIDLGTMIEFLATFWDPKFQGAMVRKVVSMESSHFLKSEAPWRFAIHLRLGILIRRRHEFGTWRYLRREREGLRSPS